MLFNSIQYLIFLPLVTLFYYVLPHKYRWVLLLAASCYFYMFFVPVYILILAFTIIVDYLAGILIEAAPQNKKGIYLQLSLVANIGVLCVFKYYNFFTENIEALFQSLNIHTYKFPFLSILLPIGLSFHTFQAMSYTLEIYKGKQKAERHFGIYALYVMFFPQLVAGPIERPQHLLSQFYINQKFEWSNIVKGLRLILMGLFKKIVIADQINVLVSFVFDNPENSKGPSVYLALLFFVWQVYCDFSGYSDIARGSAKLLGIDLMVNFDLPFFAKSFNSFWSKWHVSLMNWFRDYLLFPLIRKRWKWQLVFLFVFLISGFWHGANWTFIAWGVYNGIIVIYTKATSDYRKELINKTWLKNYSSIRHIIQAICIYHLFAFGGFFFRSKNIHDSYILFLNMFTDVGDSLSKIWHNPNNMRQNLLYLGTDFTTFTVLILFVAEFFYFEWKLRNTTLDEYLERVPQVKRFGIYFFAAFSIMLMSNIVETPFVYFQF